MCYTENKYTLYDNEVPMETFAPKKYLICFFPSSVSLILLIHYQLFPNMYVSFSLFVRFCLPLAFHSPYFLFFLSLLLIICLFFSPFHLLLHTLTSHYRNSWRTEVAIDLTRQKQCSPTQDVAHSLFGNNPTDQALCNVGLKEKCM